MSKTAETLEQPPVLSRWEKMSSSLQTPETRNRWLKIFGALAVVLLVGIVAYQFMENSKRKKLDDASDKLLEAQLLLPDIGTAPYGRMQFAARYYQDRTREHQIRAFRWMPLNDPEGSAEYIEKVEESIGNLTDEQSQFVGSDLESSYWNTLQQLHWFASINTTDRAKKKSHLERQLEILSKLEKTAGPAMADIAPRAWEPDKTMTDLWRDAAKAELDFVKNHPTPGKIEADKNLSAVFELDNGKSFKMRFYSLTAPKTVASFIKQAKNGHYDGTAFHVVDSVKGFVTGGNPFSKLAPERPRIWQKGDPGYTVVSEVNALLPIKKGYVYATNVGAQSHGAMFSIATQDPDQAPRATVFAEVVDGMDVVEEFAKATTIDDAEAENGLLPVERIGIKKVTVTGTIEHPSSDSWKPTYKVSEIPEETPEERRVRVEAEKKEAEEKEAEEKETETDSGDAAKPIDDSKSQDESDG